MSIKNRLLSIKGLDNFMCALLRWEKVQINIYCCFIFEKILISIYTKDEVFELYIQLKSYVQYKWVIDFARIFWASIQKLIFWRVEDALLETLLFIWKSWNCFWRENRHSYWNNPSVSHIWSRKGNRLVLSRKYWVRLGLD